MPEHGLQWQPRENILTYEEIERLVRFFVARGVTKVRLTGGEPTVRKGYLGLVQNLSAIEGLRELALTTNGSRLAQDAGSLVKFGLSGVNVSLDTLRPERFAKITRRDTFAQVMAGIDAALEAGLSTKINCVVMPGTNDDEILQFALLARDRPLTIRYIEFMPFLENSWELTRVMPSREIRTRIEEYFPLVPMRGQPTDVANEFEIPSFEGRVAFVSSVTESFCAGCNRLRLTADGELKPCLFMPATVSLRDMLRAGATEPELETAVAACLATKWKEHPPMERWAQLDNLAMVQIGG